MSFHWSTHQLTEYFAAVSAAPTEDTAVRVAVERAVEALDAEVGGSLLHGRADLDGLVGLAGPLPASLLDPVLAGAPRIDLPVLGTAHASLARLGSGVDGAMFVARMDGAFAAEERQMVQGMAQVLGLALCNVRALAVERSLREEYEREAAHRLELLEAVRAQQALLETLLAIQRAISQRGPLQSVLDKITEGASDLLGGIGIALVLADPADTESLILAATAHWPAPATAGALAASRESMIANAPICHAETGSGRESLHAAPVHVSGSITGSLIAAVQDDSRNADGECAHLLSAFAQQISMALTDARTVEAMQEAYRDPLTGLPNRALFLERLERALNDPRGGSVVALFIDLDRFKAVNDSLGHRAGDDLLTAVAGRLRSSLRDTDLAARLGGDEFAVLCEDVSIDDALDLAERIADRVAEPFEIVGRTVYVGASVGVAAGLSGRTDAAELLGNADVAMYRAKKRATGRAVLFESDMHTEVVRALDLQVDLKNALALGQFRLNYQPVVELDTGRVHGAEALLRWRHPVRGPVGPDEFIPAAEQFGLITDLDRWVMREAVRELAELRRSAPDLTMSVNTSPSEVAEAGFVAYVMEVLTEAGLPGTALTIELTETALMKDSVVIQHHLRSLREAGVRIAIDDFGTGYSSLSYLGQLPVDQLKIDRSFVLNMRKSSKDRALIHAVIDLARALDLQVVAEGIEDAGQLRELTRMGCHLGQGYHLYRPLEPADCRSVLLDRSATGKVPA
jgi:diguanylate cyclase (GGDEF)-like protein